MHPRRSRGSARNPRRARLGGPVGLAVLVIVTAAACSSSGNAPPGAATRTRVTSCGKAKTAAAVPVLVEIVRGHVGCTAARSIVLAYAQAVRSGAAPGNGGGGPVKVNGWICQGFATPVVLQTGKAARCERERAEILEVLPLPSPSPS